MLNFNNNRHQQILTNETIRIEVCFWFIYFFLYTFVFMFIIVLNAKYNFINTIGILCIYLSTCILIGFIVYLRMRLRYRAIYVSLSLNHSISPEEVRNILERNYSINKQNMLEFDEDNNEYSCIICMDENENEFVKLNCNHIFHTSCLSEWLINNNSCPTCRLSNIINTDEFEIDL